MEILENRPYEEGPFGSGQYTYKVLTLDMFALTHLSLSLHAKVYHIGRHIPSLGPQYSAAIIRAA